MAFPADVLANLATMPSLKGFIWQQNGIPRIVIKLPASVNFLAVAIGEGNLCKDGALDSAFQLELLLWHKSATTIWIDCLIDSSVVPSVLIAKRLEVYAVRPDLGFLGAQFITLSDKTRQRLSSFSGLPLPVSGKKSKIQERERYISMQEPGPVNHTDLLLAYQEELKRLHALEYRDTSSSTSSKFLVKRQEFEELVLKHAHALPLNNAQVTRFEKMVHASTHSQVQFPNHPFWIENHYPIRSYWREQFGIFCFRADYKLRPLLLSKDKVAYYRHYYNASQWRLDFVDESHGLFLRLRSRLMYSPYRIHWSVDPLHICPTNTCVVENVAPSLRMNEPHLCQACQREADFWLQWSGTLIAAALQQTENTFKSSLEQHIPLPPGPTALRNATKWEDHQKTVPSSPHPLAHQADRLPSQPIPSVASQQPAVVKPPVPSVIKKPVIVESPLLIDRYIRHSQGKKAALIDKGQKYLWMHSAWLMTEALRTNTDETPLQLPTGSIYIELEQPRDLHGHDVAAFSFLQEDDHQWIFSVINPQGQTTWSAFFEGNTWTFPRTYTCPEHQCFIERMRGTSLFHLCKRCQQRTTQYLSWIAIALRMLAGDFQEQVELQEPPEEVLETATRTIAVGNGETKEIAVLHRYRVIRYYDACKYRGTEPQTRPSMSSLLKTNLKRRKNQ